MAESIAARVRRLREAAGFSQRDLIALGLRQATISEVESGIYEPGLDWLIRFAVAVGCEPSELDERLAPRSQRKRGAK